MKLFFASFLALLAAVAAGNIFSEQELDAYFEQFKVLIIPLFHPSLATYYLYFLLI